jgi:DNA-directed RNA polymerase subunit L/DNA-directed RNA polymerase alpha subunit
MASQFLDYSEPAAAPTLFGQGKSKIAASFRLKNINVTVANTIRRVILSRTQSVGFRTEPYEKSDVEIEINTTPLVNEMIAHRIGMIPVVADPETFDPAAYEFHLDMENDTKERMDVRTSDFKVYKRSANLTEKPTEIPASEFFAPDPITGDTILITRLRPQWNPTVKNERLKLKAKATIGTGKENSRFNPCTQVSYEYTPNPDPAHIEAVFIEWLRTNKKVMDDASVSQEKRQELRREFETMEIQRCYLRNEKGEPNDFTFHLESVGVQSIPTIVTHGLQACQALVAPYVDLLASLPTNLVFQPGDSRFPSVDAVFQDEDHTLGNLLETYIVENHIDGSQTPNIQYVGYKVPHPLRPEMFIRLDTRTPEEAEAGTQVSLDDRITRAKQVISQSCRKLRDQFMDLEKNWEART